MKLREREAPCLQLRVGGLEDLEAKPVCWIIGSKVNSCHGSLEIDRATSHEGGWGGSDKIMARLFCGG